MRRRYERLLAVSRLLNALLGGWSDESVSSHAWWAGRRSNVWHFARVAIDALFIVFGTNHCRNAYESEAATRRVPPELRG